MDRQGSAGGARGGGGGAGAAVLCQFKKLSMGMGGITKL